MSGRHDPLSDGRNVFDVGKKRRSRGDDPGSNDHLAATAKIRERAYRAIAEVADTDDIHIEVWNSVQALQDLIVTRLVFPPTWARPLDEDSAWELLEALEWTGTLAVKMGMRTRYGRNAA